MPDISYTIHGQPTARAPVLLTHGFGASQAMWAPNLDALGGRSPGPHVGSARAWSQRVLW